MLGAESFTAAVVGFCRFVRANGIPAGPKQTVAALEAAGTVGITDPSVLMAALRAVLCSSKEEWDLFAELFAAFWNGTFASSRSSQSKMERDSIRANTRSLVSFGNGTHHEAWDEGGKAVFGAGKLDRLVKIEFSEVAQSDLPELERISQRLLRRMAFRLARRLKRKILS